VIGPVFNRYLANRAAANPKEEQRLRELYGPFPSLSDLPSEQQYQNERAQVIYGDVPQLCAQLEHLQEMLSEPAEAPVPASEPAEAPAPASNSGNRSPKEPSAAALTVYRYWMLTGMKQTELAKDPALMQKLGRTLNQGTISRYLEQGRNWVA